MITEKTQHDLVENFSEYEAVLQCTHGLQPWDSDQTVRAFQTFNWADSTTQGNEQQQFTHELTSVSVLYDGAVLAIQYAGLGVGLERLPEAFEDLFPALHALGWKRAEVYHPQESMDALLGDMGAAIPAHLEFDLVPADMAAMHFPVTADGAAMVAYGKKLLGTSDQDGTSGLMLEQMEAFGATVESNHTASTTPQSRPNLAPIMLEDDFGPGHDDHDPIFVPRNDQTVANFPPRQVSFSEPAHTHDHDHDEAPKVFSLPGAPPFMGDAPEVEHPVVNSWNASAMVQPVGVRPANDFEESAPAEMTPPPVRVIGATDAIPAASPMRAETHSGVASRPIVVTRSLEAVNNRQATVNEAPGGVVSLGSSAFYFDAPDDSPEQYDAVEQFAANHGFDEVVHLRPGLINSPVRWDLLAEIDLQSPWFAEKLASAMGFDACETTLVASLLLEVKHTQESAQLRDVFSLCGSPDIKSSESTQSAQARAVLSRLANTKLNERLDEIALRMGGLFLCEPGQAFLDIQPNEISPAPMETFSVRGLVQSPLSTFYFVHVDELDGPSIQMIASLLQTVIHANVNTRRDVLRPDVQASAPARRQQVEALRDEMVTEVEQMLNGLVTRIKAIG